MNNIDPPVAADPPAMTADEAIKLLHDTEQLRMKEREAAVAKLAALNYRLKAIYHNCMSSACFAREDAEKAEDEAEATALRRHADAFEGCAGWLHHAT